MVSFSDLLHSIQFRMMNNINQCISRLKEHNLEEIKIGNMCYDIHKNIHDQMQGIYTLCDKAENEFENIHNELNIAKELRKINPTTCQEIKYNIANLSRLVDDHKQKINTADELFLRFKITSDLETDSLLKDKNSSNFASLCWSSVTDGLFIRSVLNVLSDGGVVSMTRLNTALFSFFLSVTRSYLTNHYASKKIDSLLKLLEDLSEMIDSLQNSAQDFQKLFEKVINDLEKYIASIDNMVKRSIDEGPLSVPVLADGMIYKTKKIQKLFVDIKIEAENNEEVLNKLLRRINPYRQVRN